MFETSDNRRQLVNGRLEDELRNAANRRLARAARVPVDHHVRLRIPHLSWFGRSEVHVPTPAPKPSHA